MIRPLFSAINRGISAHVFPACGGLKRDSQLLDPAPYMWGIFQEMAFLRGYHAQIEEEGCDHDHECGQGEVAIAFEQTGLVIVFGNQKAEMYGRQHHPHKTKGVCYGRQGQ